MQNCGGKEIFKMTKNNKGKLNELTGKQWLQFTKSWFIHDPPPRTKQEMLHPAKYPETMIIDFIKFFTKKNGLVLDPFLGTGSTLVACNMAERKGVGIEIAEKYADISKDRLKQKSLNTLDHKVIAGDSMKIDQIWKSNELPAVDFVITSPPYWNMLKKSRGGVKSTHKARAENNLDTYYSENPDDLGNIDNYEEFIEKLGLVFDKIYDILKDKKYLVIIIQNLRVNGEVKPLAWDVQRRISKKFVFVGEKIWCQDKKKLGIWGYPSVFVPNYHHHYCLIFRKEQRDMYVPLINNSTYKEIF